MIAETEKKEILRTLNELGRTHGVERVFRDWCHMTAIAFSNAFTMETFDRCITPMEYIWPTTLVSPEKATDLPSCGVQKTGGSRQKQNNAAHGAGTREPIQLRLLKEVRA